MDTEMKAHTIANEENIKQTNVEQLPSGAYQIVVHDLNQQEAFDILGTMAATAGRIGAHVISSDYKESDYYLRIQIAG